MRSAASHIASIFSLSLFFFVSTAFSCDKVDFYALEPVPDPEFSSSDTVSVFVRPSDDPRQEKVDLEGNITITPFAEQNFNHQSAAVHGDYLFMVMNGRPAIRLFDLTQKRAVYTFKMTEMDRTVYHCNQSTFGTQKYEPDDYFPLLYVSQRARSGNRCFTEVFRIVPLFNADSTALLAFRTELVQEIFFPPMSRENSLGNVNCVIDANTGKMYTYSRNNNSGDSNYGQCKISRFAIPDIRNRVVLLEDTDIEHSFMIDAKAGNMQGGCIVGERLYIGQGYPYANYVYLNVVDLREERLVKRYDLLARGVDWEPEGCFYYDGGVMLTYTSGISRIDEE